MKNIVVQGNHDRIRDNEKSSAYSDDDDERVDVDDECTGASMRKTPIEKTEGKHESWHWRGGEREVNLIRRAMASW